MTAQTPAPAEMEKWLQSWSGFSQIFDSGSGSERKTQNLAGVDSGNPDPDPPLTGLESDSKKLESEHLCSAVHDTSGATASLSHIYNITRLSVNLFNNWSVNLFKPIYSLSWRAKLSPLHVTVCCKPRDRLRQKATPKTFVLSVRNSA